MTRVKLKEALLALGRQEAPDGMYIASVLYLRQIVYKFAKEMRRMVLKACSTMF